MAAVVSFVGRLGGNPEVKFSDGGNAVCRMSVAVNGFANKEKTTTWFSVTVFGKRGEMAGEHLNKGDSVFVSGEFNPREYEKDGEKRISYDVVANTWDFAGSKGEGKSGEGGTKSAANNQRSGGGRR